MSPPSVPTAVLPFPVTDQITWGGVEWERLNQLLGNPGAGGVCGDVEVENVPSVVLENQQDVQHPKSRRGHSKEINRSDLAGMVAEKSSPCLRRRLASPNHVLGNRRLGDLNTELEQFPVDTWGAPARISALHGADQIAQLAVNRGSPGAARPAYRRPVSPKTLAMPADNGVGVQRVQQGSPTTDVFRVEDPE